jgi:hypothetical protein
MWPNVWDFLLNSDLIEDVFSSDEDLIEFLVREMKKFNPRSGVQHSTNHL